MLAVIYLLQLYKERPTLHGTSTTDFTIAFALNIGLFTLHIRISGHTATPENCSSKTYMLADCLCAYIWGSASVHKRLKKAKRPGGRQS